MEGLKLVEDMLEIEMAVKGHKETARRHSNMKEN